LHIHLSYKELRFPEDICTKNVILLIPRQTHLKLQHTIRQEHLWLIEWPTFSYIHDLPVRKIYFSISSLNIFMLPTFIQSVTNLYHSFTAQTGNISLSNLHCADTLPWLNLWTHQNSRSLAFTVSQRIATVIFIPHFCSVLRVSCDRRANAHYTNLCRVKAKRSWKLTLPARDRMH